MNIKKELERTRREALTFPRFLRPAHMRVLSEIDTEDLRWLIDYYEGEIKMVEKELGLREGC